jgi:hypothetical protein
VGLTLLGSALSASALLLGLAGHAGHRGTRKQTLDGRCLHLVSNRGQGDLIMKVLRSVWLSA